MNWTPIYTTLANIAKLSGVSDAGAINWAGQPGASTAFGAVRLVMTINNVHTVGVDYEERIDQPDPLPQQVTIIGLRQFTWEIRCEASSAMPTTFGLHYLDRLRAALQRSTTDDILTIANLAIVSIHDTVSVSIKSQDRMISAYVMEVIMAATEHDLDDTTDAGGFIETVELASNKLTLEDGTDAPVQVVETIVGT